MGDYAGYQSVVKIKSRAGCRVAVPYRIDEPHDGARSSPLRQGNSKSWIFEVGRRLETASDNLDRAKGVEDVQAVSMRSREALLTLVDRLRPDLQMPQTGELPEHAGNFKGWAEVYAGILHPVRPQRGYAKRLRRKAITLGTSGLANACT